MAAVLNIQLPNGWGPSTGETVPWYFNEYILLAELSSNPVTIVGKGSASTLTVPSFATNGLPPIGIPASEWSPAAG